MATVMTGVTDRHQALYDPETGYITNIEEIKSQEYPSLGTTTYLDHAGTTLYPKNLIEAFSKELTCHIFGNPHSASAASQLSTRRIEDVRLQVLRFFNASPDHFEVVFTANATAAIKLVGDLFRDLESGFRYAYHVESHTSLVGVRELACGGNSCFSTDEELTELLGGSASVGLGPSESPLLVAFPGQSNMTGRKNPLQWAAKVNRLRDSQHASLYTLFDAAALASTSSVDLSDLQLCPDFTAVSFYKIFGFPDLGALILRKDCANLLNHRKYFGGGTVDSVVACGEHWHAKKEHSLHSQLEDGTLPFHNIVALGLAFGIHARIFGSMAALSRHAQYITRVCLGQLRRLHHANGRSVCTIYGNTDAMSEDVSGPVIAFNVRDAEGNFVSNAEFEKLSIIRDIQLRTGGLCNPGGIALHLGLSTAEIKDHHSSGYRCGGENDIVNAKPVGAVRVSFGGPSCLRDVDVLIGFLNEFFVEKACFESQGAYQSASATPEFIIESLSVFPIKSCAAFKIPPNTAWEVGPKGLAWDREWCLVHDGTRVALSQKRYPRMTLLRPAIDVTRNVLRVEHNIDGAEVKQLQLSLTAKVDEVETISACEATTGRSSSVCGEAVEVEHYTSVEVSRFFTDALGVPCTLARFPQSTVRQAQVRQLQTSRGHQDTAVGRPISLSNESPILLISRSSVNKLNEEIKARGGLGRAVSADSFRGNIVISEQVDGGQPEMPFAEDDWTRLSIGKGLGWQFEVLGPCQRCQMVCVDQRSACRGQEPFSTLSKTRRKNGRVWFGMHICFMQDPRLGFERKYLKVGDRVAASSDGQTYPFM